MVHRPSNLTSLGREKGYEVHSPTNALFIKLDKI